MTTVAFLTDYGLEDEFVGVCHAVIARICPAARIIDVSHGVPRHDVRTGSLRLAAAVPYLPDCVLLAVIDPGVGTARRPVALRAADGRSLVGPDNGLLAPAARLCGGIVEAVDIARSPVRLQPVSATFHGRDLFAPVAAALAIGRPLDELGASVDPAELVALELPAPNHGDDGTLVAHALSIDTFGNVQLDARPSDLSGLPGAGGEVPLPALLRLVPGGDVRYGTTFADAPEGELVLYADPSGRLALAVNRGSAAQRLGLRADDEIRIEAS